MKDVAVDHLSRLENPEMEKLEEHNIRDDFPEEYVMVIKGGRGHGMMI